MTKQTEGTATEAASVAKQLRESAEGRDTGLEGGAYFATGSRADHEHGVLYQGDYQNEGDGTGIAIRLHARALAGSGVPLLLKPFSNQVLTKSGIYEPLHMAGVPEKVEEEVGDYTRTSISSLFPSIRHLVVHKPEDIMNRVMRGITGNLDDPELLMNLRQIAYKSTVLYSVWERDRVDEATVREMNRLADNWVPCEQNAQMLRDCGVENVCVMPHPYAPDNQLLKLTRRKPMKSRRYYHIGRWEPRKNQVEILHSFFRTFRPGDDVHLTIKFHGAWDGYPNLAQVIEEITEEFPEWTHEKIYQHLTPISGFLRPDQIIKLHFENNIYLAPSCGEAWCLPAFEAKLAGNKVIHTPYGGTADFCEGSDSSLGYSMAEVPETYGWPVGSQWAKPAFKWDEQDSLDAMFRKGSAPQVYERSKEFEDKFSMEAVGKKMRARLAEKFGDQPAGGYLK